MTAEEDVRILVAEEDCDWAIDVEMVSISQIKICF